MQLNDLEKNALFSMILRPTRCCSVMIFVICLVQAAPPLLHDLLLWNILKCGSKLLVNNHEAEKIMVSQLMGNQSCCNMRVASLPANYELNSRRCGVC